MQTEFSWRCLALRFHRVDAFCTAQWRWPRMLFVVYRLVMSSYAIFALTHSLVVNQATAKTLTFLTFWTYITETAFFFTGAVLAIPYCCCCSHRFTPASVVESSHRQCQENIAFDDNVVVSSSFNEGSVNFSEEPCSGDTPGSFPADVFSSAANLNGRGDAEEGEQGSVSSRCQADNRPMSLPWYVQLHWVLGNVIQVFAPLVTIIYFTAIYPSGHSDRDIEFYDINVHGLNTVMVLIDFAVSARPVRVLHALYPIIYGIAYVIFSVIYWAQDRQHNVLYATILDWNNPGVSAVFVVILALIVLPILHIIYFKLYQLRLKLHHIVYDEPYL